MAGSVPLEAIGRPAGRVCGQHELEELLQVGESAAEVVPVRDPSANEIRKLVELLNTDGRLNIKWLQVITEVGIDEFVVVTFWQLSEFPAKALATRIVHAAAAPAIAPPVAKALHEGFKKHVVNDVHRTSLAERDVVRRIERLGG